MQSTKPKRSRPLNSATNELDIYAAEFAKLVDRHSPSRGDTPSAWLGRLPDEAFWYYQQGISTFGSKAQSPIERRGRLYIIHTALLFMWMTWGKRKARVRFQAAPNKGTRRAASVITLERYRRAGILAQYQIPHWFNEPVRDWKVVFISGAIDVDRVSDAPLVASVQENTTVEGDVSRLSELQANGAIPSRDELSLE